jgi:translation initiation factor 2B subunit (eIF-2B alpha/beta/delta family)
MLGILVYVAAESYKFARLYPLPQSDLPDHTHVQAPVVCIKEIEGVKLKSAKYRLLISRCLAQSLRF